MSEHPVNQPGGDQDDDSSSEPDTQVEPAQAGSTYKVLGETADADATGVVGRATDTSSITYGIYGETLSGIDGGSGVRGDATAANGRNYGVHGTAQTIDFDAAAVFGESDSTHGVRGTTNGHGYNGVFGHATSTTGISYGVRGDTESNDSFAGGVRGWANNSSGTGAGVWGQTFSGDDGAAGVRGEASGSVGVNYGVQGITESTDNTASGVRGESPGGGSWAVAGYSLNDASNEATWPSPTGVFGQTDDTSGYGVLGHASSTSGDSSGVLGRTDSASGAGVFGYNSAGGPAIEANGYVDAEEGYRGAIGAAVALNGDFSLTSSLQTIPFENVVADQRNEFDTTNHWFECAFDGTYVVELGLDSWNTTSGTVDVAMQIDQGTAGTNPASAQGLNWAFTPGDGTDVARMFTRTIFGLQAGNRISIEASDSQGSLSVAGLSISETFLSIRQVGGGGSHTSSPQVTSVSTTSERDR